MSSQHQHRRRGAIAPILTACGEDNKPPAAGGAPPAEEYPCVRRSRHRRLLTFLWLQGLEATFGSMVGETGAFFSVPRLRQLVEQARWVEAIRYFYRFLPRGDDLSRLSVEARVLYLFLDTHRNLANVISGTKDGEALAARYGTWLRHENTICSGTVRLRSIFLNIFHAKQQLRVYWDWERVRCKASEIVDDLAYRTPELKDLVLMPGGPMKPHDVLPIGLRPRYCFKKQIRRPRASTLAKRFSLKRMSLPDSSNHFQGSHDELLNKSFNWTADVIDDCLKACKRPELNQQHPLQPSGNEGASSINPVLQNTAATLTNHAINPMVSTVRGAGAPVAPLYQTTFANMASPIRNPWVLRTPAAPVSQTTLASHVRTPGAPFLGRAPALQTMFASHLPSSGTPASQTMLASNVPTSGAPFSGPAHASQTMLASNVPTPGAPFSGTMFQAPVSQTVFGCLSNQDKSSGISLMTNAGTIKHPSQESAESSQQALNPGHHPRAELSTSNEQDLAPERQHATGALGETILTSVIKTEAEDLAH